MIPSYRILGEETICLWRNERTKSLSSSIRESPVKVYSGAARDPHKELLLEQSGAHVQDAVAEALDVEVLGQRHVVGEDEPGEHETHLLVCKIFRDTRMWTC